ncbi:MAG: bacillithiol system redox-active protein YtxJ [Bacteroidota bacterium]
MEWIELRNVNELDQIKQKSHEEPVVIFKHSTSCAISSMAINRLERSWNSQEMNGVKPYYLDLIRHRDVSNQIAETFGVPHQSPQVLVVKNGDVVYDTSHMGINYREIKDVAKN